MKLFIKENGIRFQFKIDKGVFAETVKLFFPLLGQDFVESTLIVVIVGAIISRFSTVLFATYSVINAIIIAMTIIMYSYASATMTLVGQTYSSKDDLKKECKSIPVISAHPLL